MQCVRCTIVSTNSEVALLPTIFRPTKGRANLFRPETIVVSCFLLIVLVRKLFIAILKRLFLGAFFPAHDFLLPCI